MFDTNHINCISLINIKTKKMLIALFQCICISPNQAIFGSFHFFLFDVFSNYLRVVYIIGQHVQYVLILTFFSICPLDLLELLKWKLASTSWFGKKGQISLCHVSTQDNGGEAVLLTPVTLAFHMAFWASVLGVEDKNDRPRTICALSACSVLRNAFSPLGFWF